MDTSDRLKLLKEKKARLLEEQAKLIEILKTKHTELYSWMVEHQIDPTDLKPFAASITAAFLVTLADPSKASAGVSVDIPFAVKTIEVNELHSLTDEEKAKLVWKRYGSVIDSAAKRYELDPKVIFATVMVESGGNTYAVRQEPSIGDASYGLGQILYGTACGIGFEGQPKDLFDPVKNIDLIARYHKRNLDVYGDLSLDQLATAYNAGSPYSQALYGHVYKFNRWFNLVSNLVT